MFKCEMSPSQFYEMRDVVITVLGDARCRHHSLLTLKRDVAITVLSDARCCHHSFL